MEQDELWKLIESMPVFDNHCHPTLKAAHPTVPLLSVFTEGPMELTIGSMRNVRILADVFNAPSADSIVSRSGMNPADFLRRGGYIGCIVDDGFVSPHGESFEWDGMSANGNVWRVARVESIMERCLAESRSDVTFPLFLEGFRARVSAELHSRGCVGLKTICAYRCGLDLSVTGTEADMMEAVETAFRSLQGREKIRIENKTLISFLLQESVKLLSKNQVLQIHSGFGDNDLTLHKSDPSLMTPFIRANPNVPMVFLHAGYPFCRSTGWLCSVFPNCYTDFGLAIPLLSSQGMENVLAQLLELGPVRKICFSSDCHTYPHTFLLAAHFGRQAVFRTLCKLMVDDLTFIECVAVARDLLYRNALKLYGLDHKGRL